MASAPAPVPIGTSINRGKVFGLVPSLFASQSACCCPAETRKTKIQFRPNLAKLLEAVCILVGLAKLSVCVKWVVGGVLAAIPHTERSCIDNHLPDEGKSQRDPGRPGVR